MEPTNCESNVIKKALSQAMDNIINQQQATNGEPKRLLSV